MVCNTCGKKLGEGSAFCNGCGTPVENDELSAMLDDMAAGEIDDALNHRLNNVIRLRGTMAAIFAGFSVFVGIIGLLFGEGITSLLFYPALFLINAGVVLVPKFIAQYGSQGTFNSMSLTKNNMIVTFINIGAFLISILVSSGHIIALLILIPDFLLLTQVKMIYSLVGQVSPNVTTSVSHVVSINPLPVTANTNTTTGGNGYKVGQTVFARWNSSEIYFPGTVYAINGSQLDISFLDGDKGTVPIVDVLELHEAFTTLKLHGNYQNGGEWYPGKVSKTEPLTMQYDDGDVEQIELRQLRGVL